ncbi:hypothetical protein HSE3_gp092 [Bacillus phage vB_BceM-HSE3]|nr:hypothetical protein HSE3_gp092 [Bacillus phage vB_BceM-HSE3]
MSVVYKLSNEGRLLDIIDSQLEALDPSYLYTDVAPPSGIYKPLFLLDRKVWIDEIYQPGYIIDAELLSMIKNSKRMELESACDHAIEFGFTSKINNHNYRLRLDDQVNFLGQKELLSNDKGSTVSVMWKTEDQGYISHTREEWLKVFAEGLQFKRDVLLKYNSLMVSLEKATTAHEVDVIKWN